MNLTIDPELLAAVGDWSPRGEARPEVLLEPRRDGVRVKIVYMGVETGVLFASDARVARSTVHATLDRLYAVLSWRVTRPPAH